MPLLNYTKKVTAQKTVTEVMGLLVANQRSGVPQPERPGDGRPAI